MAYRETERVRQRKQAQHAELLHLAEQQVRLTGFAGLTMQVLAEQAGVAVGTLYRYFPNKAALAAAVFARATEREVAAVAQAGQASLPVPARLAGMLRVFIARAALAPQLAWALLAEPVAPEVEQQRLRYRRTYQQLYASVLAEGVASGQLPAQDPRLSAAALVGAVAEALLGPLSQDLAALSPPDLESTQATLVTFCLRAIGAGESDEHG